MEGICERTDLDNSNYPSFQGLYQARGMLYRVLIKSEDYSLVNSSPGANYSVIKNADTGNIVWERNLNRIKNAPTKQEALDFIQEEKEEMLKVLSRMEEK
jgi:hypothetical protein